MTSVAVCFLQRVPQSIDSSTRPIQRVQDRDNTGDNGRSKAGSQLSMPDNTHHWYFLVLLFYFSYFSFFFWAFGFWSWLCTGSSTFFLFCFPHQHFMKESLLQYKNEILQRSGDGEVSSFSCSKKKKERHALTYTPTYTEHPLECTLSSSLALSHIISTHKSTQEKTVSIFIQKCGTFFFCQYIFYKDGQIANRS